MVCMKGGVCIVLGINRMCLFFLENSFVYSSDEISILYKKGELSCLFFAKRLKNDLNDSYL